MARNRHAAAAAEHEAPAETPAPEVSHESSEHGNGQAPAPNRSGPQFELTKLQKMLTEARTTQERIKKVQDIVYERGSDRDVKEEKIIELGFTPSQAAEIMMDKDDTDQQGNHVSRPGYTFAQRSAAARNVKHLEASVKKQEQRVEQGTGSNFAGREDARRTHEQEGERTF